MIVTIDDVRTYWNDRPCNVRHSPKEVGTKEYYDCLLYTSPSPRDGLLSRMPSSA